MTIDFEIGLENRTPLAMSDESTLAVYMESAVDIIRTYDSGQMDDDIKEEAEAAVSLACTMIFLLTGMNKPSILEFLNELACSKEDKNQYIDLFKNHFSKEN